MKTVICSQCKSEINADDVICMYCGSPNYTKRDKEDAIEKDIQGIKEDRHANEEEIIQDEPIIEEEVKEEETSVEEEPKEETSEEETPEKEEEAEEDKEEVVEEESKEEEEKPTEEPKEEEEVKEEKPKRTRKTTARRTTKKAKEEKEEEVELKEEIPLDEILEVQSKHIAEELKKEHNDIDPEEIGDVQEEVEVPLEEEEDDGIDRSALDEPLLVEEEEEKPAEEPKEEEPVKEEPDEPKEEVEESKDEPEEVKEEEKPLLASDDFKEPEEEEKELSAKDDFKEEEPKELKKEVPMDEIISDKMVAGADAKADYSNSVNLDQEPTVRRNLSPSEIIEEASEILLKSDNKEEVINEMVEKYFINRATAENYTELAIKMAKTKLEKLSLGISDAPIDKVEIPEEVKEDAPKEEVKEAEEKTDIISEIRNSNMLKKAIVAGIVIVIILLIIFIIL